MKLFPLLSGCALATAAALSAAPVYFEPAGTAQWHIAPEQPAAVTLRLKAGDAPEELPCSLLDYTGRECGETVLKRQPERDSYQAVVTLPRGFHELEVPASGQRFGIIALEPFREAADPFFRIQSDLYSQTGDIQADGYRILRRAGIREVREFHGWDREEPREGSWDPRYGQLYRNMEKSGIKVLSYLSYPPEWVGAQPDKTQAEYQPYPLDLLKTGESLQVRFRNRKTLMDGFQVDNEPDLKPVPGNEYVPMVAAVSWYMDAGRVPAPLVGAAIADTRPTVAQRALANYMENGFLDLIDVFALHSYHSPDEMEGRIRTYRDIMKSSPKSGLPIWITESGKPWKRGIRERAAEGGPTGNHRAEVGEDMLSACWIVMKGVEAKACGVAAYYPYRYLFRPEAGANFGMCDFHRTPMRSLAAYFFSIRALANKRYAGDLKIPGPYTRKRLFSDGREAVAVLYTGKTAPVAHALDALPVEAVCGADGRILKPGPDGRYHAPDGLLYVFLKQGSRSDALTDTQTGARELLLLAESSRPVPRKITPVVYRSDLYARKPKNELSYLFVPDRIGVDLFNLSDREQVTAPEVMPPEGITAAGPKLRRMKLPPKSRTHVEWPLEVRDPAPQFQISVVDRTGAAAPLVMNFTRIGEENTKSFELNLAPRWHRNCAGRMTISHDPAENAIRIHSDFTNTAGGWSYPEYILNLPGESLEHAYAVSFEIKAAHPDGNPYFPYSYIQVVDDLKNAYRELPFDRPAPAWGKRTVLLPEETMKKVRKFRIGMGSREKEFDFWIRNIRFHFSK
ncbi:MAG: hypothetical protein HPZ91_14200 [Lentisphaeria bacterium]|nr:hypothetical protein [Lentisphaeria bacterium]